MAVILSELLLHDRVGLVRWDCVESRLDPFFMHASVALVALHDEDPPGLALGKDISTGYLQQLVRV